MKFSCDYCNSPVGIINTECENCGAKFADVRCPKCKYKGNALSFVNGCPRCHTTAEVFPKEKIKNINIKFFVIGLLVTAFGLMYLTLRGIL